MGTLHHTVNDELIEVFGRVEPKWTRANRHNTSTARCLPASCCPFYFPAEAWFRFPRISTNAIVIDRLMLLAAAAPHCLSGSGAIGWGQGSQGGGGSDGAVHLLVPTTFSSSSSSVIMWYVIIWPILLCDTQLLFVVFVLSYWFNSALAMRGKTKNNGRTDYLRTAEHTHTSAPRSPSIPCLAATLELASIAAQPQD